jgi:hypothetical protein
VIAVRGPLDRDTRDGVRLGLNEARQTAALLGADIRESAGAPGEALIGIVGDSGKTTRATVPSIGLVPAAARKRAPCEYSITASLPARAALLATWKAAHPTESGTLTIEDWHPSLARFGASEISLRYKRACGRPMTSAAWRGWCAVKALTEAALQNDGVGSCANLEQLRFDAHKGAALYFNAQTGTLEAPLYVVRHNGAASRVIGQVP